jgi:hypothetical protein
MYRVELKAIFSSYCLSVILLVPNVPCGVESALEGWELFKELCVPNAPCGVESIASKVNTLTPSWFLMHRVELKDALQISNNVNFVKFLMHRVELKGDEKSSGSGTTGSC